jgi:hypothetical protein
MFRVRQNHFRLRLVCAHQIWRRTRRILPAAMPGKISGESTSLTTGVVAGALRSGFVGLATKKAKHLARNGESVSGVLLD